MERTTLVKVLLVVAIGIPVVIESVTFLGLFNQHFGDGGETTPTPDAASIGDDLLADTDSGNVTATVTAGSIQANEGEWLLTMQVEVENGGGDPVTVTIGPVTTGAGTARQDTVSTDRLGATATETIVAQWSLPSGETPETLTVTTHRDGAQTGEWTVRVGGFAVQR